MLLRWRGALGLLCALGVALLIAGAVVRAGDEAARKTAEETDQWIINEIKERSELKPNLTHLSDIIGPRVTGSANLKRANEWTAEKFKEYGLENVKLEPYEIPIGWERGFVHMRMVEPDNGKLLIGASRAWTPGTKGRFVGEVIYIQATNKEELEKKYKGKLKNAILMTRPPSEVRPVSEIGRPREPRAPGKRPERAEPGKTEQAKTEQGKGDPSKQPEQPRRQFQGGGFGIANLVEEMARQEGAACILLDSNKPHALLVTTGSWRGRDRAEAAEPLPSVFITNEHYKMLHRLATRKDAPPPKMEIEIQAKFIPGPITVYNTVGEIKGSEKPDEFVVIGAHIDSWDLGTGTTDDGTGTSVVMESARALGKLAKEGKRPKRTIRFALFSGEEQGLHGSREYVKRHQAEMAKTSMALVHDTGTGKVQKIPVQGYSEEKAKQVSELLNEELKALKDLGIEIGPGTQGGTDHLSFIPSGVPGFAFNQDPAEYYLTHHTQSDTLDKARWPDLVQGSQAMAVTAMRVANLPELLPRADRAGGGRRGGGGPPAKAEEKRPPEKN
jgi:hypothetical protein